MSFITYFPLRANSMDLRAVVLEVVVVTRKDAFSSKVSALNTKIFTSKQQNICLLLYKILSAQTYVRITTDTHHLNGHFFQVNLGNPVAPSIFLFYLLPDLLHPLRTDTNSSEPPWHSPTKSSSDVRSISFHQPPSSSYSLSLTHHLPYVQHIKLDLRRLITE